MATVSRLTGFKPDLLRAWESRHQLLAPERGPGGQRLYSDKDVAVLHSVRALLAEGRSIGEIALIGRRRLAELSRDSSPARAPSPSPSPSPSREGGPHRHGGAPREPSAPPPPPTWPGHPRSDGATARALQIAARAVARLSARLDPAPLLQLLCDTLATDFQAALARIWVAEPSGNALLLRASAGLSRQTTRSSRARIDLRTYRFKVGVVGRTGQPFICDDIVGDPDFDQRWVHEERLAAVAILPLLADDTSYGVLAAFFRVALNDDVSGALRMFSAIAAGCIQAHDAIIRDAKRPSVMINI
jgi:DNA-binding transcriptional MerR regulator